MNVFILFNFINIPSRAILYAMLNRMYFNRITSTSNIGHWGGGQNFRSQPVVNRVALLFREPIHRLEVLLESPGDRSVDLYHIQHFSYLHKFFSSHLFMQWCHPNYITNSLFMEMPFEDHSYAIIGVIHKEYSFLL